MTCCIMMPSLVPRPSHVFQHKLHAKNREGLGTRLMMLSTLYDWSVQYTCSHSSLYTSRLTSQGDHTNDETHDDKQLHCSQHDSARNRMRSTVRWTIDFSAVLCLQLMSDSNQLQGPCESMEVTNSLELSRENPANFVPSCVIGTG